MANSRENILELEKGLDTEIINSIVGIMANTKIGNETLMNICEQYEKKTGSLAIQTSYIFDNKDKSKMTYIINVYFPLSIGYGIINKFCKEFCNNTGSANYDIRFENNEYTAIFEWRF